MRGRTGGQGSFIYKEEGGGRGEEEKIGRGGGGGERGGGELGEGWGCDFVLAGDNVVWSLGFSVSGDDFRIFSGEKASSATWWGA